MKPLIGLAILFTSMLLGFILANGKLLALWQPVEIFVILGAALGSFVISNPFKITKMAIARTIGIFTPAFFNKKTYIDLLLCLYGIATKVRKTGLMSLEADLDAPEKSELFTKHPSVLKNKAIMYFFIDNMRLLILGALKSHDLSAMLDAEIEAHQHEIDKPSEALSKIADAMPGFGIIAAVMGIVVTMQFIGGDPKLLGAHVAAALVGTLLGILFAYGIFGPLSIAIGHENKGEMGYICCIKVFLINLAAGIAPQVSIEVARKTVPPEFRPTFLELESKLKGSK